MLKLSGVATVLASFTLLLALSGPARAGTPNSGFYDGQVIEYEATFATAASVRTAQVLASGNIVFHIVDANGNTPPVQLARLLATRPGEATGGNVLNFIPKDVGYTGGAWNLQIFHWNAGVTAVELSSDIAIAEAVRAGKGSLEVTPILVRCPVINFAALR